VHHRGSRQIGAIQVCGQRDDENGLEAVGQLVALPDDDGAATGLFTRPEGTEIRPPQLTSPQLSASRAILPVERLGPFGEPLFGEFSIFSLAGFGQPIEVPSFRIWLANDDECDALARCQRQGGLGPEQTVFEAGFNQPHGLDGSTVGQLSLASASWPRACRMSSASRSGYAKRISASAPFQTPRVATVGFL